MASIRLQPSLRSAAQASFSKALPTPCRRWPLSTNSRVMRPMRPCWSVWMLVQQQQPMISPFSATQAPPPALRSFSRFRAMPSSSALPAASWRSSPDSPAASDDLAIRISRAVGAGLAGASACRSCFRAAAAVILERLRVGSGSGAFPTLFSNYILLILKKYYPIVIEPNLRLSRFQIILYFALT